MTIREMKSNECDFKAGGRHNTNLNYCKEASVLKDEDAASVFLYPFVSDNNDFKLRIHVIMVTLEML